MPPVDRRAIEIVPLQPAHVAEAAGLAAAAVRRLREAVPVLPCAWGDASAVARVVGGLVTRGSGVAALDRGRVVAFQAASLIDGHGGRWAYVPDLGHGAADEAGSRAIEALHARLAEAWVRERCLEHVVTVLADDTTTAGCLARFGFGQLVADLVRDLSPVTGNGAGGVTVRRAGPADAAVAMDLDRRLRQHLAAAPIFLRMGPARSLEIHRHLLADPAVATFVADDGGATVAFLRIGPCSDDVATIVRDPGTASITGAFTVPDRRGDGVATALLATAVDWARDAGYERCAVDHETANREAGRFWARHFTPVAVSMLRRLPPGAAA